jgi:hypothetical protein
MYRWFSRGPERPIAVRGAVFVCLLPASMYTPPWRVCAWGM